MSEPVMHEGVVEAIVDGKARVAVAVQGCAGCGERRACGIGKLAAGGKAAMVTVAAAPGLNAGDAVMLAAEQGEINRAALVGYLLPALLIVAGAVGGDRLAHTDVAAVLGAFGGLVLGVLVTRALPRLFGAAAAPLVLLRRG